MSEFSDLLAKGKVYRCSRRVSMQEICKWLIILIRFKFLGILLKCPALIRELIFTGYLLGKPHSNFQAKFDSSKLYLFRKYLHKANVTNDEKSGRWPIFGGSIFSFSALLAMNSIKINYYKITSHFENILWTFILWTLWYKSDNVRTNLTVFNQCANKCPWELKSKWNVYFIAGFSLNILLQSFYRLSS